MIKPSGTSSARLANQPIYNLIGGKYRDRVEARYWMGAKPPEKCADEVKRAVAAGFKSFKIKIGLNPEFDIECVCRSPRDAAGPRIELGYDCNGSYSQLEAIRMLRKMEPYDPSHVEEPVDSTSVRALGGSEPSYRHSRSSATVQHAPLKSRFSNSSCTARATPFTWTS